MRNTLMLIPIRWLREYVAFDLEVPQLAEGLTMAGLEVEKVHETEDDTVFDALHQIDPAARRVHLLAPRVVRRTRRQTESAMHAVGQQRVEGARFVRGRVGSGDGHSRGLR